MKTLKQVEKMTGIKADNLRQRIARKTVKATKRGRDWFISEIEVSRLLDEQFIEEWGACQDCGGIHGRGECEATNGKMD